MPDDAEANRSPVPLRHRLEYGFFKACRWLVRHVPARIAYGCMEGIALLVHEVAGWRKAETRMRLGQVLPDLPERERNRIRREAVRNLARNVMELMLDDPAAEPPAEGREEALGAIEEARRAGKGVLLVIAHTGNWDLAAFQTARHPFPMCFIAREQKNRLVYDELVKVRERAGGTVVDRDDPRLMRKLTSALADNQVVSIFVDLRARTPGNTFRYLGHEAWLANGLGLLAARSGAEVLPVYLGREGRGRHIWKAMTARRLTPDDRGAEARDRLLQSCLDDLGAGILRRPECYFWFNKRWVLEPFDFDPPAEHA